MPHYPNPFDFVPFPASPIVRTEAEFDALGEKLSGYLELEIKALTPVHIVGKVESGTTEHRSYFYRQDDLPCIPASSIRGCLRAFTEALTAGWVSQATPEYPKVYGRAPGMRDKGRHMGFRTFEDYRNDRPSVQYHVSPPAINPVLKPGSGDGVLDVASYLFGMVAEGKQEASDEQAHKSKVLVEDAYLPAETVVFDNDLWAPDLGGTAFMGGAKPSASNWWYFEPAEVWRRNVPGHAATAEFVGEHFRGRKFYFHLDPAACVQQYLPDGGHWIYHPDNPFHKVRLECLRQDGTTLPFRLYLDGIPTRLFRLLLRILRPGEHIRHKLGYAKSYGYGSIEFALRSANLRTMSPGIPQALQSWRVVAGNWSEEALMKYGLTEFIDRNALLWLARILGWPHQGLLFMYPKYLTLDPHTNEIRQSRPIQHAQFTQRAAERKIALIGTRVTPDNARAIAETLWELKQPIDFRLYQEKAQGWDKIAQRRP